MANSILIKLNGLRIASSPLCAAAFVQPSRSTTTKHWDPRWKRLRREKFIKVELPDFNEEWGNLSPQKARQKMKENGLVPPRTWVERPFNISATGGVFEPYVPPEGDGRASIVSSARAKQTVEQIEKKSKSMMAIRKIRSFDEDFNTKEFAKQAHEIYVKAHECLAIKDRHGLRLHVTERAYPELRYNTLDKTIHWKMLNELEAPRVVHARCTDVVSKDNIYGQVTVRFHTQQLLAIYDRFGRLMHGSEILAKDVLEYIVFEKHLSSLYGSWRLHDKLVPDWMPPREPAMITRRESNEPIDVGIEAEKQAANDDAAKPTETPALTDK